MRKRASKLILATIAMGAILPVIALAQPVNQCTMTHDVKVPGCPSSGTCNFDTNPLCGLCCTLEAVYTVSDWLFYVLIAAVALLVIWGGFSIATASGSEEKVNKGRDSIKWAMVGLALALLAKAIPALVQALIS